MQDVNGSGNYGAHRRHAAQLFLMRRGPRKPISQIQVFPASPSGSTVGYLYKKYKLTGDLLMLTIQDYLARTYANRELNRIDSLRVCFEANNKGLPQAEIARRLAISQPEVSRILKKIKNFPDLLDRTPREVILDFHAEKISHDQMMEELLNWRYSFADDAEPGNPEGALTSGDWDQIVDAVHRDLIDMADYEALLRHVHPTAA